MKKVSLENRINRFLVNYPKSAYIPLHPSDFYFLRANGRLRDFPLPVKCLGKIRRGR
jgi:hypothetical protein